VLDLWRHPERARRLVTEGARRMSAEFGPEQDLRAWRRVIEAATG
jgi:hypothetical protein